MNIFYVFLFLLSGLPCFLYGKEEKVPPPTDAKVVQPVIAHNKNSFFTMRYAGYRYQLTAKDRNLLIGNAMQVQIGYGKLRDHAFWEAGVSLLVGPFSRNPDLPLSSTGQGFGTYATFGWIASDLPIRSPKGPALGIQCGFNYMDMTQRSISSASAQGHAAPYIGAISQRSMRVSDLSLYPGFFLAWLPHIPRPDLIHPDSMKTRIEGYLLQFGFGIPLFARYDERYLDSGIPVPLLSEDPPRQRDRGNLHGFTVTASFTIVLGV